MPQLPVLDLARLNTPFTPREARSERGKQFGWAGWCMEGLALVLTDRWALKTRSSKVHKALSEVLKIKPAALKREA